MKNIQLWTFSLLAGCFGANAQVQNTGFEDWTATDTLCNGELRYTADQWAGGTRTEDSYSGSFAASVEPYLSCGIARNYMVYGASSSIQFGFWEEEPAFVGVPLNSRPSQLTGYFKFLSPDQDDEARGIVILRKYNALTHQSQEVGRGEVQFSPSAAYAPFTINITDMQPGVLPDSMVIAFSSGMGYGWNEETGEGIYGTLYVDQLRLANTATAGIQSGKLAESAFYPNPVSDQLHFTFNTAASDEFSMVLTDAAGRTVLTKAVFPGTVASVGMEQLPAGTYHAFIRGKHAVYAQEMIVRY